MVTSLLGISPFHNKSMLPQRGFDNLLGDDVIGDDNIYNIKTTFVSLGSPKGGIILEGRCLRKEDIV